MNPQPSDKKFAKEQRNNRISIMLNDSEMRALNRFCERYTVNNRSRLIREASVTDFGLFVQLENNRCEGLIHINTLVPGDYMLFDEKNFRLIAERSGRTFTLGDKLRVKVVRADVDKHQIDFVLAEPAATSPK